MPVFVKTEWLVAKYLCILNEGNIRELKEKKNSVRAHSPMMACFHEKQG